MTYRIGRLVFRASIFALLFVLFLIGTGPNLYTKFPTGASPLLCLASLTSFTAVWSVAIVSVLFVVGCILRRRLFCRFFCPMGCVFEVLVRNREGFFSAKVARRATNRYRWIGYIILILTVLGLCFPALRTGVLLQLDPLVLFGSIFQRANILVFSVLALCILSVVHPWFWCGNVCPLGMLQVLLYFKGYNRNKSLRMKKEEVETIPSPGPTKSPSRRHFLLAFVSAMTGIVILAPFTGLRDLYGHVRRHFLPPGALPEPRFSNVCTSCGRCIKSCPTRYLVPASTLATWTGIQVGSVKFSACSPAIDEGHAYCEEECNACSRVCPTGAIRPFSIADKKEIKIATVEFTFDKCVLAYQKECNICGRECSYEAIAFVWDEAAYANIPKVDPDKCTGCGRCIVFCPGIDSFLDPGAHFTPQTSKTKGLRLKSLEGPTLQANESVIS